MATGMEATKYQNIYQRTSAKRRNIRDGKLDVCYYFTYRDAGKKVWEKVGWRSEGFTAQMAYQVRLDRLQSLRFSDSVDSTKQENTTTQPPVRTMTFGEAWKLYAEKWLPNLAKPKDEQYRYDAHIAQRFEKIPLEAITPLDLESFKLDLLAKGLAAATVRHVLGNMRRVYNKMTEWELYSGRIPTSSLKLPNVDNARVRYLTPDEADKLLAALKTRSIAWWRIASVSLHTGMRSGEVSALTWGDLNMEDNTIYVRDAKTGTRMAHMNKVVKAIFQEMPKGQPSALVFPATGGGMRLHTDVSNTFSRVVEELKMNDNVADRRQKVVFHTLRHTFASWLAIEGVPLYTISHLMGHSSLEMTKRYAHLCPDIKQEAVAKIEEVAKRSRVAISETTSDKMAIAKNAIAINSQIEDNGVPKDDDRMEMQPMSQPRVFVKRRSK